MPTLYGPFASGVSPMAFNGFGCSSATNDFVWPAWNWSYQTQMTNDIWQQWVITSSIGTVTGGCTTLTIPGPGLTAEQRRAIESQQAQHEVQRKAAKVRARALFEDALTADQRRELAHHRYITVESPTSKRRHRIHCDTERHGNIIELDPAGVEVAKLCVAPDGYLPLDDALLGQMLFLQHDEEALRRAANITPLRRTA